MRGHSLRRVGEDAQGLLSYHPIVAERLVLVNNQTKIFAFDAKTGEPAWPVADPKHERGEIFEGENSAMGSGRFAGGLGVARFTMTAHDGRLYARMGSQITTRPMELADSRTSGYLVCLDLRAQGKVVWTIPGARERGTDDDDKWAFEGSPLAEGSDVYVAMRKSDVRPQVHVACFDAETGRRRWRTMICAAETPGGGQAEEITHNLLTLHDGILYCNTNLGAVAAVAAGDGRLLWANVYPRAQNATPDGRDKRTAHFYRDLNPCIYYRGLVLAAPADCESIFALDAATGALAWESHLPEDAVHLLGVGHGNLLASGDSLWWIDAEGGKVVKHWPATSPSGYGRGVAGGRPGAVAHARRAVRFRPGRAAAAHDRARSDSPGRRPRRGRRQPGCGGQPAADRRARQVVRLRARPPCARGPSANDLRRSGADQTPGSTRRRKKRTKECPRDSPDNHPQNLLEHTHARRRRRPARAETQRRVPADHRASWPR